MFGFSARTEQLYTPDRITPFSSSRDEFRVGYSSIGLVAGVMATAGGLLFVGGRDGKAVWNCNTGYSSGKAICRGLARPACSRSR